jgi:hypothetical protein
MQKICSGHCRFGSHGNQSASLWAGGGPDGANCGRCVAAGSKAFGCGARFANLLLEAHIPPHLIDKVQAGLSTDVRFNAFAHSPQLVVEGKVLSVSGDLLSDPAATSVFLFLGACASDARWHENFGQAPNAAWHAC